MTTTRAATLVADIPPISHREATGLAEGAYRRFADQVARLGTDDWSRPTDCVGWTVRDLVGHMVGAMRSAASNREMASQLRQIKRRMKQDGGTITDTMTQVQIDRTAALGTTELAAECRALVPAATAGRRRTPAPMRRLVRFDVPHGESTESWRLGYLVDVILTRDAWLHGVDLARAVGAPLELTEEHDGRIVADVVAEWARRHGSPFELELTGPAGGSYRSADRGGASIGLDAVEFCRTLSGRAPGEGLLTVAVPF